VANIKNDSTIEGDSLNLYISQPSSTNKGDDFYPVPSPMLETSEKMEKAGEESMEETFKKVGNSLIINNTNEVKYTYNRLNARDYANSWTSNPPQTEQYCCHHKPDGTCDVWQDTSKWNNNDYPYYDNAYCNDCADYVSQALHYGGIPIEAGQWERLKDKDGQFTWAWTYSPSLKGYMMNRGYWTTSNFTNANAGCVIRMPNAHTMMIVLNDTVTRKYSAHTNDRKQCIYYDYSGWEYYIVQ
jgi:RNA polymerase sigma-70 factor (ECF subfamily)